MANHNGESGGWYGAHQHNHLMHHHGAGMQQQGGGGGYGEHHRRPPDQHHPSSSLYHGGDGSHHPTLQHLPQQNLRQGYHNNSGFLHQEQHGRGNFQHSHHHSLPEQQLPSFPYDGYAANSTYYPPQPHQQERINSSRSLQQQQHQQYSYGTSDPTLQEMLQESEVEENNPLHSVQHQQQQASIRRDSVPFHLPHTSTCAGQQATPLQQPPSHLYNGPPVSALVPRGAPRNNSSSSSNNKSSSSWYPHGFTPNEQPPPSNRSSAAGDDARRMSIPPPPPFSSARRPQRLSGTSSIQTVPRAHQDGDDDYRRTSLGFSVLGNSPDFWVPTPPSLPLNGAGGTKPSLSPPDHEQDSPPMIPPPPAGALTTTTTTCALDAARIIRRDEQREESPPTPVVSSSDSAMVGVTETDGHLPETNPPPKQRAPSLLLSSTLLSNNRATGASASTGAPGGGHNQQHHDHATKTKESSEVMAQEATLLMGLRTDTTNSPRDTAAAARMPMTSRLAILKPVKQVNETIFQTAAPSNTTLKDPTPDAVSSSSTYNIKELPKTCFPVAVPKRYPKRLSTRNDHVKLNSLHCFIRAELLEVFVVEEKSDKDIKFRHAPSSSVGRVGLRCIHCALKRNRNFEDCLEDEAPMSVFYPKAVGEIYRMVTSWQRCHLRKCKNLPPPVRNCWDQLRATDKSRGKTAYWVESARAIGLRDCPSRTGGIRFEVTDHGGAAVASERSSLSAKSSENDAPALEDTAYYQQQQQSAAKNALLTLTNASKTLEESDNNARHHQYKQTTMANNQQQQHNPSHLI